MVSYLKNIVSLITATLILSLFCTCKIKQFKTVNSSLFDQIKGIWSGQLVIQNINGKSSQIPMSLEVLTTERDSILTWVITYDKQTPRPYTIHAIDPSKGLYQIDELNGIVIPALHRGSELITNYEVMGNHMTVIYDLTPQNELLFKVNMWRTSNGKITGDTIMGGDTIPKVTTYLPTTYQIARLKKVK